MVFHHDHHCRPSPLTTTAATGRCVPHRRRRRSSSRPGPPLIAVAAPPWSLVAHSCHAARLPVLHSVFMDVVQLQMPAKAGAGAAAWLAKEFEVTAHQPTRGVHHDHHCRPSPLTTAAATGGWGTGGGTAGTVRRADRRVRLHPGHRSPEGPDGAERLAAPTRCGCVACQQRQMRR